MTTKHTRATLLAAIAELDEQTATDMAKAKLADLEHVLAEMQANMAEDEGNKEEQPAHTMSNQLRRYRVRYVPTTAYSGRKSMNNADDVAVTLAGMTPKQVCDLAEKVCGLPQGSLWAKYESLNPGQQRMNSGNRIRAAIKRGDVTTESVVKAAH